MTDLGEASQQMDRRFASTFHVRLVGLIQPTRHGLERWSGDWLIVLHVLALGAPFCFSWSGLGLAVLFTGCAAVGDLPWIPSLVDSHRARRSALAAQYVRTIGTLAGEGGPISWTPIIAAHAFSDQVGDPHSPRDGKWWSHAVFWLAFNTDGGDREGYVRKWVRTSSRIGFELP